MTASRQDRELDQPGCSAVPVSEGVDPGYVKVRVEGLRNNERELDLGVVVDEDRIVQPFD
jgi:hypothetical protein